MTAYHSFGYQYENRQKYYRTNNNFSHTGFAWSVTRRFYEICMQKLMQYEVLGSADYRVSLALLNRDCLTYSDKHKQLYDELRERIKYARIGYVPVVISHLFHGSKANRKYTSRYLQLIKHRFDPELMLDTDENGLLVPSKHFPKELSRYNRTYFKERCEDE